MLKKVVSEIGYNTENNQYIVLKIYKCAEYKQEGNFVDPYFEIVAAFESIEIKLLETRIPILAILSFDQVKKDIFKTGFTEIKTILKKIFSE